MENFNYLGYSIANQRDVPIKVNKPIYKDLNSGVDPVLAHQRNQQFLKKKKKNGPNEFSLTIEEGEKLLDVWRKNNFADFNSWIQIAKAQINTESYDNTNEINKKSTKSFTCNLTLTFEDDPSLTMIANGFGRNKKDAKKMAIEKIVIELIQNEEIRRGLRDKNFLNVPTQPQQALKLPQMNSQLKEPADDNLQKKIHKLSKKMQECLKKDKFLDACEILCQIVSKKAPDWNEISFIWSYALLKKNLNYIKAILDLIQHKRIQSAIVTTNQDESKLSAEEIKEGKDEKEKKANQELLKKYGNARMKNDNPYDVIDAFNVEMNLPEIDNVGKEITDEEANAEIVRNPLSVDMTKALVQDNSEVDIDTNLPKVDLNKIKMYVPTGLHPENVPNEESKSASKQQINDPNNSTNLKIEENKFFITPFTHYDKENYGSHGNIDYRGYRDLKDPGVNYLSYKLLNELYESAMYICDLNFALCVAEILYTRSALNDEEFINSQAAYYYANKKNMLVTELMESIYQIFSKNKNRTYDTLTSISGRVEKIGNKYAQEVLQFSPDEHQEALEMKISRRGFADSKDVHYQMAEGEFVLLSYANDNYFLNQLQGKSVHSKSATFPFLYEINKEFQNTQNYGSAMIGCIKEIGKDYKVKVFVLPSSEQSSMLLEKDKLWKITKLANKATIDKTCESLETFCTKITMAPSLLKILLTPPVCDTKRIQEIAESDAMVDVRNHVPLMTNLNQSQQNALFASNKHLVTLIQGPPGTGKTTTAVEIVLEWLRASNSPILACADSNIAVDLLHSEFLKAGIRAIRIGTGYDDRNEFKMDKNYKIYNAYYNSKQYQNANNVRFGIMKRMLNDAQVVCATCVGSTSEYLKGMSFTRVILDEATQATEMSTLIPLTKNCQQLVLIGDHKQLPPTVISTFAQSKGMTISLFERFIKQGVKPHLLNIQYRMHPSISVFPSHQFYANMLENGVGDEHRPIIPGFNWPNSLVRVAFINVKGTEQIYSSSIQNPKEVEVVIEVLLQLLKSGYNHISGIGIITPYDAQKRKIRSEVNLQAKKFPQVFGLTPEQAYKISKYTALNDIDTVDGYQGMERDLIIFSAVRSNNTGSLGFLRDPRRLNVTLTRAKRGLIVIGDLETLYHDSNWKDWINWCKINKIILNYK